MTPNWSHFVPDFISVRRLMAIVITIMCSYSALVRGGVHASLQWPVAFLAFLLCLSLLFLKVDHQRLAIGHILKDPVFRLGGGFLILLFLQMLKSGYTLQSTSDGALALSGTPTPLWPWSMSFSSSAEMLLWFFPPWVAVLLIRNVFTRFHVKMMFSSMVWTAAVVAGIGVVQSLFGMKRMLSILDIPGNNFFATFDYVNHAAEWLYLNAFLAAGLAYDALKRHRPVMQQISWSVALLLCVAAGILTSSRIGAMVSGGIMAMALYLYLKKILHRVRGSAAMNIYIGAGIIVLVGATLFFGSGGGRLASELKEKTIVGDYSVAHDMGGRFEQMPPAWRIIADYPVFGAGAWSYESLAQLHVPQEIWLKWDDFRKSNVHCDPLQFFSEFGLVGLACLAGLITVLVRSYLKTSRIGIIPTWVATGLGLVLCHSLIDLPFRCPAILLQWSILAASLPVMTDEGRKWADPLLPPSGNQD